MQTKYLSLSNLSGWGFAAFLLLMTGCASIPGNTRTEQVETIDALVKRTLDDLYKQNPKTKEEISHSVGYVIMNNKITKVPVVGVGAGYGVAIHTKTGEQTYLRMGRFDVGGGWGARSLRPVLIFQNEKKFTDLISGEWSGNMGAEAAAKVGDAGAAGGGGAGDLGKDKGYSTYTITDAGVSATVTAGVIRIAPIKLRKK
jgi:hypothetical protein